MDEIKELFSIEPSMSPRLAWKTRMLDGNMLTHRNTECDPPWCAILVQERDKGKSIGLIMAESCRLYDEAGWYAEGDTELEAMEELAVKNKIPLSNEQ